MGLLTLLNSGIGNLGYDGATVPSTVNANLPGFTRHNLFSTTGQPNQAPKIIVGGVNGLQAPPRTYIPSRLEETDPLNTSIFNSAAGNHYTDHLPG
jgi:hypothetical protein